MSLVPVPLAFLGTTELIVIAVIALLLFGTRLPKVARSLGQSVTEFKSGLEEGKRDAERPRGDYETGRSRDEDR